MRVLHVTPYYVPAYRYGGPIEAVHRLNQALLAAGVEVKVATTRANGREELDVPGGWVDVEGVPVRYFPRTLKTRYFPSHRLIGYLLDSCGEFDLVHISTTFSFPSTAAGLAARRKDVPYLVSPHGSLLQWALRHKLWKKLPYWLALERRHLRQAMAIHANAENEAADVLRILPEAAVFQVPYGHDVPALDVAREPRRIVFLGRIHKVKGLDVLVPALAEVARTLPDVETLIAGPDEGGEWERVERLVEAASPRPRVRYLGPIYGGERFRLLASAAAFVLPSHSENFGMTAVEAMACGTPVVVSRNCPWRSVEERGAGAWVENTPHELAAALLRILTDPGLGARMGAAGKALAQAYSWPVIGRQMAAKYAELLESRAADRRGG